MAADELIVHGAREHNLKDIDVRLPRNSLVCITGLSGSGKSSLAFDTIYAEGQRRYVESLSAYARQFLQMMEKPDVDSIEGLSPAISIDQKTTSRNPRSTVGTVTEIYDYLRLLYARVGRPHCPVCGRPIAGQSLDQIVEQILALPEGTRFTVNAPIVRDRKGEFRDVLEELRADGFTRVKVDGEVRLLEEEIVLDKKFKHEIEVVVDRLVLKPDLRQRLTQSVETAAALADGLVAVDVVDGEPMLFSREVRLPRARRLAARAAAADLLLQLAARRLPALHRARLAARDRPRPDRSGHVACRSATARSSPGRSGTAASTTRSSRRSATATRSTPTRAWRDLTTEQQDLFLHGTKGDKLYVQYRNRMGRRRSYTMAFEGIVSSLAAPLQGDRLGAAARADRGVHELPAVRHLQRRAAQARGARGHDRLESINEFTRMSVTRSLAFLDELGLTPTEELIGHRIVKEIRERLTFLDNVGVGYLQLDRAAKTLSGGEAQRLRLATQIGSQLVGVLYILDEPSIGLHQRDNGKLIGTLQRLKALGNTVLVVEHDEQMMRTADWLVDMGPGAGEHGGYVVAEGTAEGRDARSRRSVTGQFLSGKRKIAIPPRREDDRGHFTVRGAVDAQPEGDRRRVPGREVRLRHRRLRLRQVDARERDRLQGAREPAQQDARQAGRPRRGRGDRRLRQGDRHRPEADRPHAALEPGDLHRPLHAHPRALLADAGGEGARLQAGPLLVQRSRRPLRDVQGRRDDQDRDALPAGRLRPVRDLPRAPVQQGDARGALQGQVDRRRARDVGRGGARPSSRRSRSCAGGCRRCTTSGSTTSSSASRRRRSPAARRSGSSSRPSSARSRPAGRSTSSTSPRPASTSPTSRSCSRCSSGSSTPATRCS